MHDLNSHGMWIMRGHRAGGGHKWRHRSWRRHLLRHCILRKSTPKNLRLLLHRLHWLRHGLLHKGRRRLHLLWHRCLHNLIGWGELLRCSKNSREWLCQGGKLCKHKIRSTIRRWRPMPTVCSIMTKLLADVGLNVATTSATTASSTSKAATMTTIKILILSLIRLRVILILILILKLTLIARLLLSVALLHDISLRWDGAGHRVCSRSRSNIERDYSFLPKFINASLMTKENSFNFINS